RAKLAPEQCGIRSARRKGKKVTAIAKDCGFEFGGQFEMLGCQIHRAAKLAETAQIIIQCFKRDHFLELIQENRVRLSALRTAIDRSFEFCHEQRRNEEVVAAQPAARKICENAVRLSQCPI